MSSHRGASPVRLWAAAIACSGVVAAMSSCGSQGPQPTISPKDSAAVSSQSNLPAEVAACGTSYGPDGALDIVVIAGQVDCLSAKIAADEYMGHVDGFLTNQPLEIANGWICWPSSEAGSEIVRCNEGDQLVSLQLRS